MGDISERALTRIAGMIESCDKKRGYKKLWLAALSASHHPHRMRAYRCLICNLYHLTSK